MSFEELEKNIKIANWIKEFRDERLAKISETNSDQSAKKGGKIIMHIIPLDSLDPMKQIVLDFDKKKIEEIGIGVISGYNSDGLKGDFNDGHFQLFRNGAIEWSRSFKNGVKYDSELERDLISCLDNYMGVEKSLGFEFPIYVMISMLNVKDQKMDLNRKGSPPKNDCTIKENKLMIGPLEIRGSGPKTYAILRPAFDAICRAAGEKGCPYYDNEGKRIDME